MQPKRTNISLPREEIDKLDRLADALKERLGAKPSYSFIVRMAIKELAEVELKS